MSNPNPRKRAPVPADQCGLAHAATLIGDRWSLLLLRALFYGLRRFDDLAAELGASRAILSDRLNRLAEAGLVARVPYREDGQRPRHEYMPTEQARALGPALLALFEWGATRANLPPTLRFEDRETGSPVRLAMVDSQGRIVPASRVQAVLPTGEIL